ncbi:MAG: hypothetical protein WCA27_25725 [Candidatus Sulfotelmatobacter sp.]
MSYVGVNIGALTAKVVRADAKNANVMAHQARLLEVLETRFAAQIPECANILGARRMGRFAYSGWIGCDRARPRTSSDEKSM